MDAIGAAAPVQYYRSSSVRKSTVYQSSTCTVQVQYCTCTSTSYCTVLYSRSTELYCTVPGGGSARLEVLVQYKLYHILYLYLYCTCTISYNISFLATVAEREYWYKYRYNKYLYRYTVTTSTCTGIPVERELNLRPSNLKDSVVARCNSQLADIDRARTTITATRNQRSQQLTNEHHPTSHNHSKEQKTNGSTPLLVQVSLQKSNR